MKFGQFIAVAATSLGLALGAVAPANAEKIREIYLDETDRASASDYTVTAVHVIVPEFLRVSEARNYYPDADLVWRADPPGDRYAQVDAIVTEGVMQGVAGLNGPQKVEIVVQIARFHCLTERARAVTGGFYGIKFYLQVRDPVTHQPIRETILFDAQKVAYGRNAAVLQELTGQGQKFQIREHMANMIRVALEASE